jgi:hypothetical protein
MTLPIAPVVMPSDLAGQPNGKLDAGLLTPVGPSGTLHHTAARAWRALVAACAEQGLPLTYTYGGTYRTYAQQETLFRSRYAIGGQHGGCKMWDSDGNGSKETWCKKLVNGRVPATAAVPGTSNHGWGLAIDTAYDSDVSDGIGPDDAAAITGHPKWPWFLANAERFGFSWELQSEPWHIRYVTGDTIPASVLAFESPTEPERPITPKKGQSMIIDLNPDTNWVSMELLGNELTHLVNGHHVAVLVRGSTARVKLGTSQFTGETELSGILESVRATNDSPFAPGKKAANPTLHTAWTKAQARKP